MGKEYPYVDNVGLALVWSKVKQAIADLGTTKVDKIEGKGLSANDYTTAEKNKLSGIETGAEANVIETIMVNSVPAKVTSKSVNIGIPTNNISLINGAGYQTANDVSAAIVNKVDKIAGKGLSTNDYSTVDKNKLNSIEAGAEVNTIKSISVNNVPVNIVDKTVNITVPKDVEDHAQVNIIESIKVNGASLNIANKSVNIIVPKDVEDNAQVNIIENIKVNDTALDIIDKSVNITVPTDNASLTNGAGYQTSAEVQSAIEAALEDINVDVDVDLDGYIASEDIDEVWTGTLAEYNALETKDPRVLYNITDDHVQEVLASQITNDIGFITNSAEAFDYDNLANKPTIPTATSELINDSGYIKNEADAFSYSNLSGTPSIPSKTSELNNDSGYIKNEANAFDYTNLTNKPTIVNVYVGTADPDASLGNNGDIYIKVE